MKVGYIYNGLQIGDDDNARSIAASLGKMNNVEPIPINLNNPTELYKLNQDEVLVVGAGSHSLNFLKELSKFDNIKTVWSAHQQPAIIDGAAIRAIDNIVLPEYEVGDALKRLCPEKLIELPFGVPNSLTQKQITAEYQQNAAQFPKADKYVAVVLGGDAKDKQGSLKHYTEEEAYALGRISAQWAKDNNMVLLATNGPRTGAYDEQGNRDMQVHRDGVLDVVSQAFLRGTDEVGLPSSQMQFYDFQFDKPSMFKAILGAVQQNEGSFAVLPAESTSMLTEAVENLSPQKVVCYEANSMSEAHHKQVSNLFENGYVYKLDVNAYQLEQPSNLATQSPMRSADIAAIQIDSNLRQTKYEKPLQNVVGR
jgi:mitochondrial fission protein ELM1